ncbi:MAG TPA: hypothetical protein VFX12_10125 [Vicinamibacterales bacterium]|nr:hypothetical protein [Vicinamibacterales bacterium]
MRIAPLLLIVAAGCSGGQTPAAPDASAPADTWMSWAKGFTMTYCAASCHAPGGIASREGVLDFTMYSKVYDNRVEIRCGVSAVALSDCAAFPAPKQFPCSAPYPTDADRMRLVAWIDAGAPQ